jgi:hypothetical protein
MSGNMTGEGEFQVQSSHFHMHVGEQNHCSTYWSVGIILAAETVYDSRTTILKYVRTSAGEIGV